MAQASTPSPFSAHRAEGLGGASGQSPPALHPPRPPPTHTAACPPPPPMARPPPLLPPPHGPPTHPPTPRRLHTRHGPDRPTDRLSRPQAGPAAPCPPARRRRRRWACRACRSYGNRATPPVGRRRGSPAPPRPAPFRAWNAAMPVATATGWRLGLGEGGAGLGVPSAALWWGVAGGRAGGGGGLGRGRTHGRGGGGEATRRCVAVARQSPCRRSPRAGPGPGPEREHAARRPRRRGGGGLSPAPRAQSLHRGDCRNDVYIGAMFL